MPEIELCAEEAAQVALLLSMPLHYCGLVVENTNRCNASCAMCYQSSGPSGPEGANATCMDVSLIKRFIREAADIETIASRFHLAGGEAFLYLDDCYEIFRSAQASGFALISAATNAYWGASMHKARNVCASLRDAGLNSLEVSWDYWHSEFIPAASVNHCLLACREAGIDTTLRLLTTRSHPMEEALSYLSVEAVETADRITSGPVFATGRAATTLSRDEFYYSRASLNNMCYRTLNLTINAFGQVFPCCAGFDQNKNYICGNVADEPLDVIVARMDNDPILRQLVFSGVSSFLPILEEAGYRIGEDYFNICHLCSTIFTNAEYTDAIRCSFERRQQEALMKAVSRLEAVFGASERK